MTCRLLVGMVRKELLHVKITISLYGHHVSFFENIRYTGGISVKK